MWPRAESAPRSGPRRLAAAACGQSAVQPPAPPTRREHRPRAASTARTLHPFRVCRRRLEQQGLRKEAKKHMTRALKINTKAFGEEHANTKDTAANLDRLRGGKDADFDRYAKKKDPILGRVRDEL